MAAAMLTNEETSIRDIHDHIVSRTHPSSYENTRKSIQQVRDGHVQQGDIPDRVLHAVEQVIATHARELFSSPGYPDYSFDPRERYLYHIRQMKHQAEASMNSQAVWIAEECEAIVEELLNDEQ
jgi:hypothetical protein